MHAIGTAVRVKESRLAVSKLANSRACLLSLGEVWLALGNPSSGFQLISHPNLISDHASKLKQYEMTEVPSSGASKVRL